MEEELYDSQEVIEKCLNCPYLECVNCIGKPKNSRLGKNALKASEMLKQGKSRMQIQSALKVNRAQLYRLIDSIGGNEVADENDKAIDDIIYTMWGKGCTYGKIAKELGVFPTTILVRIRELGLK